MQPVQPIDLGVDGLEESFDLLVGQSSTVVVNVVAAPLIAASGEPSSCDSTATRAGKNAALDGGDNRVMSPPDE